MATAATTTTTTLTTSGLALPMGGAGLSTQAGSSSSGGGLGVGLNMGTSLSITPATLTTTGNHLDVPYGNNPNLLSPDVLNQRRGKSTLCLVHLCLICFWSSLLQVVADPPYCLCRTCLPRHPSALQATMMARREMRATTRSMMRCLGVRPPRRLRKFLRESRRVTLNFNLSSY